MKNRTPIPTHRISIGDLDQIPQIKETAFLSDKVERIHPINWERSIVNEPVEFEEDKMEEESVALDIIDNDYVVEVKDPLKELHFSPSLNRDNEVTDDSNAHHSDQKLCGSNFSRSSSSNITCKTIHLSEEDLSSKEAVSISMVLGEVSLLLINYSHEKTDLKKNLKKPEGIELKERINNLNNMLAQLQQQILKQVSELELSFRNWERSFLANNSMCAPTVNDMKNDPYAADIFSRVKVGKSLLDIWNIAF